MQVESMPEGVARAPTYQGQPKRCIIRACSHQMALLHRLLILMLLGAARAPPPGGGGSSGSGDSCAEDGSSATYTETIKTKSGVSVREIVSTGCPNHESYCTGKPGNSCGDEGEQTTLVEATEQSLSVEVPANPKLKNSFTAGELDCSMGTVAYALNGVGFYSGAVAFDSGGNCPQNSTWPIRRRSGSRLIAVPGTARAPAATTTTFRHRA